VTDPDVQPVPAEVAAFVGLGVATIAATRSNALVPEITRGWGPAINAEAGTMELCLGLTEHAVTRANLEANGAIAVTCSLPTTYRSVQVKGTATRIGEPDAGQLDRVARHLEAFVAETQAVGIAPALSRRLLQSHLLAVRLSVSELYDQTPGPTAGARL
jgi:hypothetical protein